MDTEYPDGSSVGNTKEPACPVFTMVWRPVLVWVAVTVAPATTAPVASVTVPTIEPYPCAIMRPELSTARRVTSKQAHRLVRPRRNIFDREFIMAQNLCFVMLSVKRKSTMFARVGQLSDSAICGTVS